MGEDLSRAKAAELIGVTNPSWWRWEVEKDPPTEENLKAFIEICRQYGIPGVTLAWIRYGSGEGPPRFGGSTAAESAVPKLGKGKKMPSVKKDVTVKQNPRKRRRA